MKTVTIALLFALSGGSLLAAQPLHAQTLSGNFHKGPPGPPAHAAVHRQPYYGHVAPRHRATARMDRQARRYADLAIRQVRTARQFGFYSAHPRWSPTYHDHYYWALETRPYQLDREIAARDRKLAELRRYGYRYGRR